MAKRSSARRLPFAGEFSPGQVDLAEVLRIIETHTGDRAAIIEAIRTKYFGTAAQKRQDPAERLRQQRQRAENVVIGIASYGLFDAETASLTEVGRQMAAAEPSERTRLFARHILSHCHGAEVLQTLRDLQTRGERVTKRSLHIELKRRGFQMTTATTRHLTLLKWLEQASVIDTRAGYKIDEDKFASMADLTLNTLDELASLPREQRAFLQTVHRLSQVEGATPLRTSDVLYQAQLQHGDVFKEDQLSAQVLRPLERSGWVSLVGQGGGAGRGGKSGQIAAMPKLLDLDPRRLAPPAEDEIPPELRPRLNTSLERIYTDLESNDTHRKGIALELLALRIVIHLGLIPRGFRERGVSTGGSEVDLIAEGVHLHFSRWTLQCKNTAAVPLSALDKEIGMAVRTKAHVIVLVTTGRFARGVEEAARELARDGYLQVVLLGGDTLRAYRERGMRHLLEFFKTQAGATMRIKREQLRPTAG